jgi:cytochrome c
MTRQPQTKGNVKKAASMGYLLSALGLLSISLAVSAVAQSNLEAGRNVFLSLCFGCHAVTCNKTGPKLQGLFTRSAGTLPDFPRFTDALKKSGIVWDAAKLDEFLADPPKMVPGTSMWVGKINDARERQDLIAYLRDPDISLDICPR